MKISQIVSVAVIAFSLFALLARLNVVRVKVGQVGILTEEWGDGLVEKDFGPGFHLDLGPLHSWELFDTTVQTLSMIEREGEGPLLVKSDDGATVTMDITIKYRIRPGECWRLRQELGTGDSYKTKVRNEAIDAMRPVFGSMDTEGFYLPEQRLEKTEEAKRVLTERLLKLHVDLIEILVRDVSFEQTYEQRIKEKALAKQEIEVNIALREAAFYRGETDKIGAETAAKVTVIEQGLEKTRRELTAENEVKIAQIRADANKYVVETRADADLFAAEKVAEADLLIKNAEAEAQALRQGSLQGDGAKNLIALEAARNLQLGTFVVSTLDNNVLDLEALLTRLRGK